MSHQQQSQSGPEVSPQARVAASFSAFGHSNALEKIDTAFAEFRPLVILTSVILTSDRKSAAGAVIQDFLDCVGDDVVVARVAVANSNAIAGMREIMRAVGLDPTLMRVGEMENVLTKFLSHQKAHDRRTIICIDDAPDNAQWVLDRVQYLVKLESQEKYGLMVILSGRAGLNELLKEHPLDALADDVAERVTIAPLAHGETQKFVRRRFEAGDSSEDNQSSERHAIPFLRKFRRRVPDAVKNIYVKWLHVAGKEKANAVPAGPVESAAPQVRPDRLTQSSEGPAQSVNGNGASPAVGRLIVHVDGEIIQAEVLKRDHILIGRSKMCDLRLVSHKVSRHHAMVVNSSNGTDLVDLRSKNGTFVDGRPIERYRLHDNDALSIGGCRIRYIADDDR